MTEDPIVYRIQTLLVRQKKTSKDLETALGLSNGVVSKWKYEGAKSYIKYMPLIAEYLNVTVEDLMGDDVPNVMASTDTLDVGVKTTSDERHLLDIYRNQDEYGRKCMLLTMKYISDLIDIKNKMESDE
jgi:transcriptional regulator with XRE-family HTH domain